MALSQEAGQVLLKQLLDLYVLPEIERRKKEGQLEQNYDLTRAQIIFYGDGRTPVVRLNSEVLARAPVCC